LALVGQSPSGKTVSKAGVSDSATNHHDNHDDDDDDDDNDNDGGDDDGRSHACQNASVSTA